MVAAYIRFSTDKQDQTQQKFALDEFAKQRGLTIDTFEMDEGVSGGVSYRERNLYNLIKRMKAGDTLITTEISRLGRSMGDVNMLVTQELKPRKLRLIVVKMGLDLDCSNLKAVDEMIIFAFSFSAQCEKEMIQQRTQSAIDARKEAIKKDGGFFSKTDRWCTHLGRKKGTKAPGAGRASGMAAMKKAGEWRDGSALYTMVSDEIAHGVCQKDILAKALRLYEKHPSIYCTRNGKPLCWGTLSRWAKEIQIGI